MNDDQASRLFDRLGADIPDRRPAMDHLVHAGRAARHRRRTTRAVLAACAATAVVLVGGAVALGGSTPSADVTPATTSVPQAPDGMRLVGRGRAVVAVPDYWRNEQPTCNPVSPYVAFAPAPDYRCTFLADFGPPSEQPNLLIGTSRSTPPGARLVSGRPASGVEVRESRVACDPSFFGLCSQTVTVPSEDASISITATGDDAAAVVRRIRDSLQLLPEGFTTVPYVQVTSSADQVAEHLRDAGLDAGRVLPGLMQDVAADQPQAGSVVRQGVSIEVPLVTDADLIDERLVTSPEEIVGTWVPIELYGEPVTSKAALVFRAPHGSRPPTYTVDDEVNVSAGKYAVSPDGAFEARVGVSTAVGCVHNRPGGCQIRSRDAVEEATMLTINQQDRLVMRGADGTAIATYERASVRSSR